jgi:hypothetical protein
MNTGKLILSFSEPVAKDGIDFTLLTLQSSSTGGTTYTLTEAGVALYVDTATKSEIELAIATSDLEEIQKLTDLAVSKESTFISVQAGFTTDTAGVDVVSLSASSALQVQVYAELAAPELTSFDTDMDKGELTLTFSAAVLASSLSVPELSLQSAASVVSGTKRYVLTTSTSASANGFQLTVSLSREDLDGLKAISGLADSVATTFISITADALKGLNGAAVRSIIKSQAKQTSNFQQDQTKPAVSSFAFTLDSGRLAIKLSEVVDASTIDPTGLTLQSGATATGATVVLGGGAVSPNSGLVVEVDVTMLTADLNALKSTEGLGTSTADTFLVVPSTFVTDLVGLACEPIADGSGLQAAEFSNDQTRPELNSFSLDLQ